MQKRIITISRQFGSGGHSVGKLVAEKLGIAFYDNELVTKVAADSGFDVSFVEENYEKSFSASDFFYGIGQIGGHNFQMLSLYDQLYIAQHNVIRDIAEKESCVIVGRCADYILDEREDCLHTFIYADNASRAERIIETYGASDVKIEKRIKDKDSKRKSYYRHYTNREWGDPLNYHVCLNSGVIGVEECAEIIASIYKNNK